MRVWIDQDLCTGDGLCLDHAPDVFVQLEDGIAYVAELGAACNDPGGSGSLAWVTARDEQAVIDAALGCPGECIFIETDRVQPARRAIDAPTFVGDVFDGDVFDGETLADRSQMGRVSAA